MTKLLIVDDDAELSALLKELLEADDFEAEIASNGERGLERAASGDHALVVLDLMLPKMNGMEVLKRLRSTSSIPVILLTAKGEEVDRVLGLEFGADDYLPKPFSPRELIARIRAILRRTLQSADQKAAPEKLVVGDVELDTGTRAVRRAGQPVDLTAVEFNLLEALLREAGRVVSRELLVKVVLGRIFSPFDRSIDMHISKLRKKLGDQQHGRDYIKTIRSVGYIYSFPGQTRPR